jgi:hypothetical protein
MNLNIKAPKSWRDITVGLYETVCPEKPDGVKAQISFVEKICGLENGVLMQLPASVFDDIVKNLQFLFEDNPAKPTSTMKINGIDFTVSTETELTLGEWVDVEEAQKSGENVISGVLAIVCRPVGEEYSDKNYDARQAMFAALPMSEVLGVLAFFLHCKSGLEKITQTLSQIGQTAGLLHASINSLRSAGGGTKLSQKWQAARFWILRRLLNYRLRKYLCSEPTRSTRILRNKNKRN